MVNDDNPVVRIEMTCETSGETCAVVYGSPWSGKTPCYRNVSYPLGGIVMLSQAPYNKICRLDGIHAYAALVQSISGKRWEASIADGLHRTENTLVSQVPIWHFWCHKYRFGIWSVCQMKRRLNSAMKQLEIRNKVW